MLSTTEYIDKINDLYIMTRYKYILQKKDGSGYTTLEKPKLNDSLVKAHLNKELTLGVFAGQLFNKFLCFDIDCKAESVSVAQRLIEVLTEQYGISHNELLVSFSGHKGIHVELFFDETIRIKDLQRFYRLVLKDVGANENEIEFRNTNTQAVKLPLSLNWKTKKDCYLMDSRTFERIDSSYLLQVSKIDTQLFIEELEDVWSYYSPTQPIKVVTEPAMTVETDTAEQFEEVLAQVNLDLNIDYQDRIISMITENSLLYANSRHNSTLLLAMFYKEQGYLQEETEQFIKALLLNTWQTKRHLYSSDTTLEHIEQETERLTALTYEKGYKLGNKSKKPIRLAKEDLELTLEPNRIHLKKLLFTMIAHSKRYAVKDRSFYMTYKQMAEMGNTKDRKGLIKYVSKLEELGMIEVVRRNERKEKSYLSKPNIYRLKEIAYSSQDKTVELQEVRANDFETVATSLLSENEIKQLVSYKQFRTSFKEYYTQ